MLSQIIDEYPAVLDCRVVNGALVLSHAGSTIDSDGLKIKIFDRSETALVINDFEHDGVRHMVNAFTQQNDGSLVPWDRTTSGVRLPVVKSAVGEDILDVRVMSTTYAPLGDFTARELKEFVPQSLYTPAAVKVRMPSPDDSRPGG